MLADENALSLAGGALLIIDMQNDFLHQSGYYARRKLLEARPDWDDLTSEEKRILLGANDPSDLRGYRAAELIETVAAVSRSVALARTAKWPIAFIRASYDRNFPRMPPLLSNDLERRHYPCRCDTWGARLIDDVQVLADAGGGLLERTFEKHTYDAFTNPELNAFFRALGVRCLFVCGVETHVCVAATAQSAVMLGYRAAIVEDAVWSANQTLGRAALSIFANAFGQCIPVAALEAGEFGLRRT
ncbi:MAG: cysteine hydrolase family protein [Hyphomicrobiaceae bacterium]